MAALEQIIRPYVLPNTSPAQKYIPSGQKSADPILLQIGRSGQGKTFNGSASTKVSFYCDAAENETH